jgi:hypothetical protein
MASSAVWPTRTGKWSVPPASGMNGAGMGRAARAASASGRLEGRKYRPMPTVDRLYTYDRPHQRALSSESDAAGVAARRDGKGEPVAGALGGPFASAVRGHRGVWAGLDSGLAVSAATG